MNAFRKFWDKAIEAYTNGLLKLTSYVMRYVAKMRNLDPDANPYEVFENKLIAAFTQKQPEFTSAKVLGMVAAMHDKTKKLQQDGKLGVVKKKISDKNAANYLASRETEVELNIQKSKHAIEEFLTQARGQNFDKHPDLRKNMQILEDFLKNKFPAIDQEMDLIITDGEYSGKQNIEVKDSLPSTLITEEDKQIYRGGKPIRAKRKPSRRKSNKRAAKKATRSTKVSK